MIASFVGNATAGTVTIVFDNLTDAEAKLIQQTTPEVHGDNEDAKGTFAEVVDAYLHPPE